MQDIASTTPRLFFRIGSGDDVTWGYCTGMTDNTTTYDLTGCQLGLLDYGPGTTVDTANINSHSAGEAFVITNQHHWYNYYFANVYSTSTIYNTWTFPTGYQYPNVGTYVAPIDNEDLAPKKYVDDTASAGAADATIGVKGLVEIGTATEMASSTPTGSGTTSASLVPNSTMTTSSPYQAGTYIPVTETDGKLNTYFIDKADTFAWTGNNTHSGTNSFTGNVTTTNATSTSFFATTVSTTNLYIDSKLADTLVGGATTNADSLHTHTTLSNFVSSSVTSFSSQATGETFFSSSTVPANVLNTRGWVHFKGHISVYTSNNTTNETWRFYYGTTSISMTVTPAVASGLLGEIDGYIISNGSANSQTLKLNVYMSAINSMANTNINYYNQTVGTATVNSAIPQAIQFSRTGVDANHRLDMDVFFIEYVSN